MGQSHNEIDYNWSKTQFRTINTIELECGYWHQRADERHDNPPQGNQELLLVRDKVGRPQVSLG